MGQGHGIECSRLARPRVAVADGEVNIGTENHWY